MRSRAIDYLIAAVWLVNGLFCKLLNLVPRHQEIVARILGPAHAPLLSRMIGLLEIVMAVWIISGYKSKINAVIQMIVILSMNMVEAILAPDLLLWGRINALYAFLFVLLIFYNHLYFKNRLSTQN